MSSVTKVPTGWRARWRTPDGKSRSKTFMRKIDAEKHLTATDHAKLTGAYADPRAPTAFCSPITPVIRSAVLGSRTFGVLP